jgi:hypothetical protein
VSLCRLMGTITPLYKPGLAYSFHEGIRSDPSY